MKILAIGGCGSMGRYAMRAAQNYSAIEEISSVLGLPKDSLNDSIQITRSW